MTLVHEQDHPSTFDNPDVTAAIPITSTERDASPEGAPARPKPKFGFSEIANLFIRLRRHRRRATVSQKDPEDGPAVQLPAGNDHVSVLPEQLSVNTSGIHNEESSRAQSLSPPTSPSRIRVRDFSSYSRSSTHPKAKPHHLVSSSGDTPISHPGAKESVMKGSQATPVGYTDHFDCVGGVNIAMLLRATRNTLLETVERLGANALVDEQWDCTICGPKRGTYKVEVNYSASATRCAKPDPHRPVALDRAEGIPGLMTILKRED